MNNKRTGDASFQVAELLGKVEAMVAANQGCGYLQAGGGVTDEPLLSEEEEEEEERRRRRRAEQEAADQRLLLKNEQRQALRSELGEGDTDVNAWLDNLKPSSTSSHRLLYESPVSLTSLHLTFTFRAFI